LSWVSIEVVHVHVSTIPSSSITPPCPLLAAMSIQAPTTLPAAPSAATPRTRPWWTWWWSRASCRSCWTPCWRTTTTTARPRASSRPRSRGSTCVREQREGGRDATRHACMVEGRLCLYRKRSGWIDVCVCVYVGGACGSASAPERVRGGLWGRTHRGRRRAGGLVGVRMWRHSACTQHADSPPIPHDTDTRVVYCGR
jgi:hypothetical protein